MCRGTVKQNKDLTAIQKGRRGWSAINCIIILGSAALELDEITAVISYESITRSAQQHRKRKNKKNIRCAAKQYRYTGNGTEKRDWNGIS
jgi:hypothetical protein